MQAIFWLFTSGHFWLDLKKSGQLKLYQHTDEIASRIAPNNKEQFNYHRQWQQ